MSGQQSYTSEEHAVAVSVIAFMCAQSTDCIDAIHHYGSQWAQVSHYRPILSLAIYVSLVLRPTRLRLLYPQPHPAQSHRIDILVRSQRCDLQPPRTHSPSQREWIQQTLTRERDPSDIRYRSDQPILCVSPWCGARDGKDREASAAWEEGDGG